MLKHLVYSVILALTLALRVTAQDAAPDVLGEWDLTTLSPLGESTNTVAISKGPEGLKAVAKSPQGEREYDSVSLTGKTITLVITIAYENQPMTITYSGSTDGKVMNGSADFGGLAQGSFSAARKPAAAK